MIREIFDKVEREDLQDCRKVIRLEVENLIKRYGLSTTTEAMRTVHHELKMTDVEKT